MKAEEVLKLFRIPAHKLISHKDVHKWREVLKSYRDFKTHEVEQQFSTVLFEYGEDKPVFYYLSAVRRRLLDKQHQEYKTQPMPQSIRQMFR